MLAIGGIIAGIAGIACLVFWIMVLIKHFQAGETLHGILGVLTCGLWTFIWGWVKHQQHGTKKLMVNWTIAWVVYMLGAGLAMPGYIKKMKELSEAAIEETQSAIPETLAPPTE